MTTEKVTYDMEPVATAGAARGLLPVGVSNALFDAEDGFEIEHEGGSMPMVTFEEGRDEGKTIILRYVSRHAPEDPKASYMYLVVDVLDPEKLLATRDPKRAKLYQAEMVESYAIKGWFEKSENLGRIARLTYHGSVATSAGRSKMKRITVEAVTIKAKK